MPVYASFIYNVTITFEGDIFASAEYQNWTLGPDGKVRDVFAFDDSKYLLFNGKGTVDG